MPRNTALIGASFLTGVIILTIALLGISRGARADALPASPAVVAADETAVVSPPSEFEAGLAQRESALLDQLALRQTAIDELDANYGAQLAALEDRLAATNAALTEKSAGIESLQAQAQATAGQIAAADLAFQDELTRLQNGLASEDAQIRAQIEAVYAQLQGAYDQIAAAQAAVAQSGNGGGGSSVSQPPAQQGDGNQNGDDHDDDHEDSHDNGDHDDDHNDD